MTADSTAGRIESICDEICNTLKAKNLNYGDAASKSPFFLPWLEPESGLWVRLGDKVERLKSLLANEPDRVGESIRDTLLDNIGYSILLIIELDRKAERTNPDKKE